MDHLMAGNITKIIKTAKWGKSNQKNILKKKEKNKKKYKFLKLFKAFYF